MTNDGHCLCAALLSSDDARCKQIPKAVLVIRRTRSYEMLHDTAVNVLDQVHGMGKGTLTPLAACRIKSFGIGCFI